MQFSNHLMFSAKSADLPYSAIGSALADKCMLSKYFDNNPPLHSWGLSSLIEVPLFGEPTLQETFDRIYKVLALRPGLL
ncbi:hypothetical protein H4Q26_010106 [Puccinia striiformis f. sp. tritici PST-130]|nr:hypothetical protein H4Q26_010106 [Puccinia striiformis f. sp. tritici PST-130]